ncbi:fungal-specific transcription factor domain-containing protein [Mycena floridula]|nr:fungal-specific transcription factor domain-containing protein [Mycena floridula]
MMPQAAAPRKDPAVQRAQDKESKRARGALSCAECRRLKLKCDKTVPCSSCKRRGCSAICPNGSLVTGQGTRFVLASSEELHKKIARMSDRIRALEDALSLLQSTTSSEPHPLLDRELLKIKSSLELHAAVDNPETNTEIPEEEETQYIDAFGTLAIREDGASTFYGRSAGSESLLIGESANHSTPEFTTSSPHPDLAHSLSSLSNSFPFANSQQPFDIGHLLENYLPSWQEACRLISLYLDQAPWFFGAVTRRQLVEEMLPLWYNEAPSHSPLQSPNNLTQGGLSAATVTPNKGGAHELALLFIIFCFGALTDVSLPAAPDNLLAEQYYSLTKAALTIEPVLERPPSVSTVQTLSLMAIYEGLRSGENSIESTWSLMGLATKLAQSIGLHRDCARWKLTPSEVQKRRALFWELFITDCWQSLATGRLATFSLPFVDCELPHDTEQIFAEDGTPQPSFSYWKAKFGAECVSAVVQGTLTSRAPKYSIILELDRKVRDIEFPKYAQEGPVPEGLGLSETMSHFMPTNYRELTLLYIHRCFFAHAITSNPVDPINTPYAPSFLAGYRSACVLLGSIKKQFTLFPAQISRFWVLWTHAFSASVMISSVVTNGPRSKVAPAALLELKAACDLFEKAAPHGGRAVKFLPIMRRLLGKAQKVYHDTSNGIPPNIPNDIFRSSSGASDEVDELSIFSGKTRTVTTRVASAPPSSAGSPPDTSRSPSDSPPQTFLANPAFANVHPSLVHELNGFDGQLNAQLQRAYQSDSASFTETLMGFQQPLAHVQPSPVDPQQQPASDYRYQQYQTSQPEPVRHAHTRRAPSPPIQHQRFMAQQPQYHASERQQPPRQSYPAPHGVTVPESHSSVHRHVSHQRSYNSMHSVVEQPRHDMYIVPDHIRQELTIQDSPSSQHSPVSSYDGAGSFRSEPQTWNESQGSHQYHQQGNQYTQPQEVYYQRTIQPQHHQQHYTPDGAMHGMAAEDHGLQQTWTNYMHQVGSPRLMFEE